MHTFWSHVETVSVCNGDYTDMYLVESLEPLWLAVASSKASPVSSVTLSACVTNLGHLISSMLDVLFKNAKHTHSALEWPYGSEEDCKFS